MAVIVFTPHAVFCVCYINIASDLWWVGGFRGCRWKSHSISAVCSGTSRAHSQQRERHLLRCRFWAFFPAELCRVRDLCARIRGLHLSRFVQTNLLIHSYEACVVTTVNRTVEKTIIRTRERNRKAEKQPHPFTFSQCKTNLLTRFSHHDGAEHARTVFGTRKERDTRHTLSYEQHICIAKPVSPVEHKRPLKQHEHTTPFDVQWTKKPNARERESIPHGWRQHEHIFLSISPHALYAITRRARVLGIRASRKWCCDGIWA